MKQELMTVVSNHQLAPKIFELVLTGQLVKQMHHPGQFLHCVHGDLCRPRQNPHLSPGGSRWF